MLSAPRQAKRVSLSGEGLEKMTQAASFALAGVVLGAATGTIQRFLMRQSTDVIPILIFNQLAASAVLVTFFGLPEFSNFTYKVLALLLLSGTFWSVKSWALLKALRHLDLNTSAIIGKLNLIILTLVSMLVFNEEMTSSGFLGVMLILAAVLSSCNLRSKVAYNKGAIFNILGVVAYCIAVTIEKVLTSRTDILTISVIGFLFPGLIVLFLHPRKVMRIPGEIVSSKGLLLLLPFGYAGASFTLIKALQLGKLSENTAIYQMNIVFAFLSGIVFLKEYSNLLRKSIGSALCVAGALMVCFY